MDAFRALEEAAPYLADTTLAALRRYAVLGMFMEKLLTGNVLEGSINATALQRTSAKDLLERLQEAGDRLVVMYDSNPSMLLVNLEALACELENLKDLTTALERSSGPWITDEKARQARLKELGMQP